MFENMPERIRPQVPPQAPVTVPEQQHRAVTKSRKRTSHGLHLVLTVVTFGLWGLLVWLPITLWHKFGPRAKSTTRYQ
jgi:hypothetical protein